MKVYTKTGDQGETSLFGGKRVKKYELRIEAYGTSDELNSWIGLIRAQEIQQTHQFVLEEIQDRIFTLGAQLAADPDKPKLKMPHIKAEDIAFLETKMDEMDESLPVMTKFTLPGGNTVVSYCHLARCVCRRCERRVIELSETAVVDNLIIQYLNRLSDYLFVLGRKLAQETDAPEVYWEPKDVD
ncbi:MAG: cob(I)yrinic acid a,c-diamide adenosyltransferase [Flavobacteriales bacterium]|nr:cob(I)yrinic acid a,c-diamide adenosyltransferase [Flavobacteriales bacterium]